MDKEEASESSKSNSENNEHNDGNAEDIPFNGGNEAVIIEE